MRKSRFTEEQIIGILKEHDAGAKSEELCRRHGISGTTFYKWKAKFGGFRPPRKRPPIPSIFRFRIPTTSHTSSNCARRATLPIARSR